MNWEPPALLVPIRRKRKQPWYVPLRQVSWYLKLGEPQKTLDVKEKIAGQIEIDQDMRLLCWIPLDWARAHLMLGDVERSFAGAREFYQRVIAMESPHAMSRAYSLR